MIAFMAMSANAQVTWNVRAGAGVGSVDYGEVDFALALFGQYNIPFGSNRRWTFSPTIQFAPVVNHNPQFALPLLVGHKIPFAHHYLFIPKIGPFIGYDDNGETAIMFGPSIELACEIKHFVIALNGSLSITTSSYEDYRGYWESHDFYPFNTTLSVGYKF